MSLRLLLLATLPLLPIVASAGEMPKEGDDSYTHTLVVTYASPMKVGERTLIVSEQTGISLNDNGRAIFNNMGTRCMSLEEIIGNARHARGGCTFTDQDGDQIMLSLDRRGDDGSATLVAGTGKFVGISGTGEYTHRLIKADDKFLRVVVSAKVHWKLQ
jgi:hypothetical protein